MRAAQFAANAMLQAQLDEESGLRGFLASRQTDFLAPFHAGENALPRAAGQLRAQVIDPRAQRDADDDALVGLVDRAVALNARWMPLARRSLAAPPQSARYSNDERAQVDAFRADMAAMQPHLSALYELWVGRRDAAIRRGTQLAFVANGIIAAEVIIFACVILLLRRELDRERGVVQALQRVAAGALQEHPVLEVGASYYSATRGSRVGGDVFDVYRLDSVSAMLVIGDVSGKGLSAAVDTTFIRYALRAFASESRNPAEIVTRFNALYGAAGKPPEAFVVLFVGILDTAAGTMTYTSAGHEVAFVRRPRRLDLLPPTDPVVGLEPDAHFNARTIAVGDSDAIVLATDGLSEARDPQGSFLPDRQIAAWIAGAPETPQSLADELAKNVRSWTHNRPSDDLAILVVRKKAPTT